ARILDRPTRPQRMLTMAIGLFVGLLGGVMIAFLKDSFDTSIWNINDVKHVTGISAISIIPTFDAKNGSCRRAPEPAYKLLGSKENHQTGAAQRFVLGRSGSPEAEALQGLQTSIMFSR